MAYTAIAPALACAVVTQIAFLLKQRGARTANTVRLDRPLQGARALLGSPWFVLGMGASGVAWVLHLAALAVAPLSIVQAVLASGVIILALLGRFLFGWRISRRQWCGISLTAGALCVLVVTLPAPATHAAAAPGTLLFVIAVLGAGATLVLAPRLGTPAHWHGATLGAAAGMLLGVSDVANKTLFRVAAGGPVALISSPWLLLTAARGRVRLRGLGARIPGARRCVRHGLRLDRCQPHRDAWRDRRVRRRSCPAVHCWAAFRSWHSD